VNKLGKDSVRDLGNNESEQTALAGNKGSSLCVGKVLEIGNRLPNAGGKHGVHEGTWLMVRETVEIGTRMRAAAARLSIRWRNHRHF